MLSRPRRRQCDRASRRRRCGARPRPAEPPSSSPDLAGPAALPLLPHQSNSKAGFFKPACGKSFRIKNYEDFEQCVNRVFWVYFLSSSFLSSVLKFHSYTDENTFKIFCLKKKEPRKKAFDRYLFYVHKYRTTTFRNFTVYRKNLYGKISFVFLRVVCKQKQKNRYMNMRTHPVFWSKIYIRG
jgi:hypothetical protein